MTDLEELEQLATETSPEPWRSGRHPGSHCLAGHEYTEANTRFYRNSKTGKRRRICRECSRIHSGFKNIYRARAT